MTLIPLINWKTVMIDLLAYCRPSAQDTFPKREATAKQKWMTSDILQKMERRRLAKLNVDEYNKLDAEIRMECQIAKELMITA